jgi:Tetratricopeptide repeat
MKAVLVVAIIVLVASVGVLAQTTEDINARLDSLRAEGYEALYNLDYDGARQRFREMVQLAPDNPDGAQCLASSFWLQLLNKSWELKATLYSDKSYAQTNDNFDEQRANEFRSWIRQAKQLSQARLRRDPRDQEALYFLGAAEGLDAAFSAAIERKFMRALRSGSDSVEHHRQLLKLAPEFHDAELTIGLYDYIIGSLPLPSKILVGSMGIRGSKKRGLGTLEKVSREGHRSRDLARVLLVDIYKREKRWDDAIDVSRQLADRYPRNYLFRLQLADALTAKIIASHQSNAASPTEVLGIFDSLLNQKEIDATALPLIHFRYGETLLLLGNSGRALKEFQVVASHNSAEPGLRTMSRLRVAQCLDLAGKRIEALATYRSVLNTTAGSEVQDEARRGLREPYRSTSQIQNH